MIYNVFSGTLNPTHLLTEHRVNSLIKTSVLPLPSQLQNLKGQLAKPY